MKYLVVKEPVYGSAFTLFYDCSFEQMRKFVEKNRPDAEKIDEGDMSGCGYFSSLKDGKSRSRVIWIETFDCSIEGVKTIVHELLHATFETHRRNGLELCKQSEEAYTYLFEFYCGEVMGHLFKKHYKASKK
jgi:hypothetical protein